MPAKPKIVKAEPYPLNLDPEKQYAWCACGLSSKHPFCDGSHQGTEFNPIVFSPKDKHMVWLCGCSYSKTAPYCDASHNKLDKILGNKKPAKSGFFKKLFKRFYG